MQAIITQSACNTLNCYHRLFRPSLVRSIIDSQYQFRLIFSSLEMSLLMGWLLQCILTYHLTHISKWASILNVTICIDDWEQQKFLWKLEISEEHYWFKSNILLFKLGFFYITYLQASFNIHYISGSYHIKFNLQICSNQIS